MAATPNPWSVDPDEPDPTIPLDEWGDFETALRKRKEDDLVPEPCGWALVVYAGTQLGRVFPLVPGENMIGRSPTVGVSLLDEEVSRIHSTLRLETGEDGDRLTLEDMGSTNGTSVNGQVLEGLRPLVAGDRLTIGGHVLKLVAMDPLERSFHETLLDQSTKDPLTGLANRGAILGELQSRFDLSRRHGRPLSVVMCDLDHFKRINDTHGHGAGDLVLSSFGDLVRQNLRGTDLAGRIGGEEFLLVLPETEMEGAMFLAERLRTALGGTPQVITNAVLKVTCSLGVAERNAADRDGGMLLGRADGALYQAKRQGRDRVVSTPKS
jgi:two-component system cell cycle response regulator